MGPQDPWQPATHPVLACVEAIARSLAEVRGVDPLFLEVRTKREALVSLSRLEDQLHALWLRVIAASDDVADLEGHRDVASWLTHRTHHDRATDRRAQRLATSLSRRWTGTLEALGEGRVSTDQAEVIAAALDDLPGGVATDVVSRAEHHLIEQAAQFGPRDLRRLGRRILEVVAPDVADDEERTRLESEERRARRRTTLATHPLGDGTTLIKARVPDAVADRLLTYLHAYTSPRAPQSGSGSLGEKVPYPARLGHAFGAFLEHADPRRHPLHGGDATTVLVTIDLTDLIQGLGVATTDTGQTITAAEARRLACTARLVPAVLGTRSEVLNLGRSARLFSPAQRRALRLRDQECRAEGCDIPAAWCEAHHLTAWSRGGRTDLADGALLCSHHHHRIHDDRYLHTRLPNGDLRFHRRS